MPRITNIQARKGTASDWLSQNPILASGEFGYDLTNKILKLGDGLSNWTNLSTINLSSSNITDFNIAVSGLLPVKNIIAGNGVNITSSSGVYTINASGSSDSIDAGVYPLITISSQPSGISVIQSSNAIFNIAATASYPTAPISYQWQTSTDNILWNNIQSSTSSTLTLTNVAPNQNNQYYRCNLQSLLSNISSNSAQLVVIAPTPTPTNTVTPTPSATPVVLSFYVYNIINLMYINKIENTIYNLAYDA